MPGLRGVFAVSTGPDGRVWMTAEQYLFVFDTASGRFVYQDKAFPDLDYTLGPQERLSAHDADLVLHPDGQMYGTIHGRELFRVDPETMRVTVLYDKGASHLALGPYGNVYFSHGGNRLMRYVP